MDRLLMIIGVVITVCGIVVSVKHGKNGQGALEWIIFIAGLLVFAIGLNL